MSSHKEVQSAHLTAERSEFKSKELGIFGNDFLIFAFRNRIDIWLEKRANVPYWVDDIVISYCILRELKLEIAYYTSWNDLEDMSSLLKEGLSWHSDNKGTLWVFISYCHTVFLISVRTSPELLKESSISLSGWEVLYLTFYWWGGWRVVCQRFDVKYSSWGIS